MRSRRCGKGAQGTDGTKRALSICKKGVTELASMGGVGNLIKKQNLFIENKE